jgi:hypothetical protein
MVVRITSMEFPVMSRASGQARPGAHRFSGTATGGHGAHVRGLLRVRCSKRWPPTPPRCCPTGTYFERPSPTGFPGMRAVSSQLEPHAGPILTGGMPSACPSQRIRAVISGHDGLLRSVLPGRSASEQERLSPAAVPFELVTVGPRSGRTPWRSWPRSWDRASAGRRRRPPGRRGVTANSEAYGRQPNSGLVCERSS